MLYFLRSGVKNAQLLAAAISMVALLPESSHADNIIRISAPIPMAHGSWLEVEPLTSPWEDKGGLYGCQRAVPAKDFYYVGVPFEQTHSGCLQDQTSIHQNRLINSQSGEIRTNGSQYVVARTLSGLSYTTNEIGTSTTYSVIMRAGRYTSSTASYVGMYARSNTGIYVGNSVLTPDGDRVQVYFSKPGAIESDATCGIRLGITLKAGWTPGASATGSAIEFGKKANVLTLYDVTGNVYKSYKMPVGSVLDGGYHRTTTVDCEDMLPFYNNPGYITKVTLTTD